MFHTFAYSHTRSHDVHTFAYFRILLTYLVLLRLGCQCVLFFFPLRAVSTKNAACAALRRSGRLESRDGGNEGAITPISVHDHQLGSSGLQCGDGDGELGAAVVRLVYSGQHAEHGRAPPARAARRSAPQAAHVFHELRKLGYKAAVGWVVRAPAAGDEAIYDAYMREAGATGRTEAAIARL